MAAKVLSIEIGQQSTKVCELDYNKKTPTVYHCITFDTPQGSVEDGYIKDKVAFATALKEQLVRAGIKNDKVIFTVSSTKIANREAVIPFVKENRIREIIMANVTEYFPVNVEEYNISYSVLERVNTKEEKQIRLLILAAPGNLIKSYFELADIMQLNIVSIDYVGNSTFQLLRNQVNEGVNLVVQMNDRNTIVNLLENNNLLIQRILPYGTLQIEEAILGNPVFGIESYQEAREMLVHETIINPQFGEDSDTVDPLEDEFSAYNYRAAKELAKTEVTASLQELVSNMLRILDYLNSKYSDKKVGTVYLTGEFVEIKGISQLFHNELGLEVELLCQLLNVNFDKKLRATIENQSKFLSCLGAPIAPIDFTPKEYEVKQGGSDSLHFPVVMLALCVTGAIAICVSSYFVYKDKVAEKKELELQIAEIEDIEQIYNQYMISKNNVENMEAMHEQTYSKSQTFLSLLEEIEQKTPNISTAASFSIVSDTLTLSITSDSKVTCAKYIEQMKTIELLGEVKVSSIAESNGEDGRKSVTYTVVCELK